MEEFINQIEKIIKRNIEPDKEIILKANKILILNPKERRERREPLSQLNLNHEN